MARAARLAWPRLDALKLAVVVGAGLLCGPGAAPKPEAPAAFNAIGPLYPVLEQDLLEHIEAEIASQELSGELDAKLEQAQRRALAYAQQPPAVEGLRVARRSASYLFDPSVALGADVIDAAGRMLHPAGTRVNPLEHVALERSLLFFDERDAGQVELALRLLAAPAPPLPILVGGSPLRFGAQAGVRAYFDQAGAISRRLQLSRIPALISQQGTLLRVDVIGRGS